MPEEGGGGEGADVCWYCGGADPEACPVCSTPKPQDREEAIRSETTAVHGQDGWAVPDDPKQEERGRVETPEGYNIALLCESEGHLRDGNWEPARELSHRACMNLERHIDACEGRGTPGQLRPFVRRGERELLALAFAHRARCGLLKQDYREVIDDSKRFARIYAVIVDAGNPELMHKQERKVLGAHAPGASFIGKMTLLGAACEIASQCRDRVGNGFAPKIVLEHAKRAIDGLETLDFMVFPGLNSLRAHLYITRAHAGLELGMWEQAKEDAELALACDPTFTEAEYMKQSAEDQEW
mmetsp:Transcript_86698/g.269784  ORF Transcript_86698/g.269784 Transcript_86698/m.269784 type:complete len:298 (+) Transcript_86698:89-982(+)